MKNIQNRPGGLFHRLGHWLQRLIEKWNTGWSGQKPACTEVDEAEEIPDNPWIYATREVIEQILLYQNAGTGESFVSFCGMARKGLHGKRPGESETEATERALLQAAYREFRPMILDTDCPEQVFGEEDDVDQILEQLYPGLNFLEICTDRPEHFAAFADWLECEYGLIVRMLPLAEMHQSRAGMILDLQRHGELHIQKFPRDVGYIPFYKRRWREVREAEPREDDTGSSLCTPQQKSVGLSENTENTGEIPVRNLDIEVPIGYNVVIVKVGKTLQKFR